MNNSAIRDNHYSLFRDAIVTLLEEGRRFAARSVGSVLTVTYWEIGRRIIEFEQKGRKRAEYGKNLLENLSRDLTAKCGRGFGVNNLERMRLFYLSYPSENISPTPSGKSESKRSLNILSEKSPTVSGILKYQELAHRFPLSWSHYVENRGK